jgi:hypothetical protein
VAVGGWTGLNTAYLLYLLLLQVENELIDFESHKPRAWGSAGVKIKAVKSRSDTRTSTHRHVTHVITQNKRL